MEKFLNKILIVDGSYLLHRSLSTPSLQELETSKGFKTGGVFGSLRILQFELKNFPDYFPIFCFDKGLSKRRTDLYSDYKNNQKRIKADNLIGLGKTVEEDEFLKEYRRQRKDLIPILKSLGIPSLIFSGWEGDDLQYFLSLVCNEAVILSDDKDLIQLVAPNIKIRRSMRDELIEWETSDPYYHYPRYIIRKAIVGDKSDNIPNCVKGIGEKTADLISQLVADKSYEQIKPLLEWYCSGKQKGITKKIQSLLENWDTFERNYKLIDLHQVEFPPTFESLVYDIIEQSIGQFDVFKAYQLIGAYEMTSIFPDQIINQLKISSENVLLKEKLF